MRTALILATALWTSTAAAQMCGDVTQDGSVDVIDALEIARCSVGMASPTPMQMGLGDTNLSGTLEVVDAYLVAVWAAGMGGTLPCTELEHEWRYMRPTTAVNAPQGLARGAYDPTRRRYVAFGGNFSGTSRALEDVWSLDLAAHTWQQIEPNGVAPSARMGHSTVYDSNRDRTLVFWQACVGPSAPPPDENVYAIDWTSGPSGQWEQLATVGRTAPRIKAGVSFDEAQDAVIIHGGRRAADSGTPTYTTALDFSTTDGGEWRILTTVGVGPTNLNRAALLYDPAGQRHIYVGRLQGQYELFELTVDLAAGTATWRAMQPEGGAPLASTYEPRIDTARRLVVWPGCNDGLDCIEVLDLGLGGDGEWRSYEASRSYPPHLCAYAFQEPNGDYVMTGYAPGSGQTETWMIRMP